MLVLSHLVVVNALHAKVLILLIGGVHDYVNSRHSSDGIRHVTSSTVGGTGCRRTFHELTAAPVTAIRCSDGQVVGHHVLPSL
jgi:hypothetical protein